MNLKQARYICTIAEEGSITEAAKKLYISQPSLSQMLRSVEEEAGVSLFERSPFRPTFAGERYLHAARVMLHASEILHNELEEIRQGDSGRLRLGISRQRAAALLPAVLPRFSRLYPHVVLELREEGSATLERMLQEGVVDLAFATTNPVTQGLEYRLMQRETIGILAGRDSMLAGETVPGTPIRLDTLKEGSFVALKTGHSIRVIQDLLFRENSLHPAIYLETDSMETALQVTAAGSCYMLVPDVLAPAGSFFYPLREHENLRHFYACFRQGYPLPGYAEAFLQLLQEELVRQKRPEPGTEGEDVQGI